MFTLRLFKIKKHTRRVLIFKRSLPVFSFLLATLMLLWPIIWAEEKEQFSAALPTLKDVAPAQIDMENVRFSSQDKKNQSLTVVSPRVLGTDSAAQLITLFEPTATYKMESGTELKAETSQGVVNKKDQTLTLENEVVATTDTGYKAVTKNILCDNQAGLITGKSSITVTGPEGRIKAQGFRLYNKGNNIDFTGKTDSTLKNKNETVRIESDNGLNIDQAKQTVTAFKNVRVTQTNQVISADKMTLYYLTKAQQSDSRIQKIEVNGHIVATSGIYKLTGNKGVYNPQTGAIVITENVVLYQGNSHISGEQATLNLKTGENTLVPHKGTAEKSGRVHGTLIPTELKGLKNETGKKHETSNK